MMSRKQFSGVAAALFTVSLWGGLPILRGLAGLPPMLVAAVAMAAAATLAGLLAAARPGSATPHAAPTAAHWLSGVGGLVGALYFYFLALDFGDPAPVTLVTYTWPLGLVLVCDCMAGRGLRWAVVLGAAVAFAAVTPLLASGAGSGTLPPAAAIAGLGSGGSWIAFSLHLRHFGPIGLHGYRRMFCHAAVVSLALHLAFEGWPGATAARDWAMAALIGLGPYGIAFMSWGYALRNGPSGLVGTLAYAVPVIAAVWLIVFGMSTPNTELLLAALGVCVGAVLTERPWAAVTGRRLPRRRRTGATQSGKRSAA